MDGEEQRDVARVYFSAFLEVVLRDRLEYLPIFSDARYAAGWLPNTFYINQYSNSAELPVADFEEDIDPTTNSLAGGRIETAHLSKWYEARNSLKWDDLDTHSRRWRVWISCYLKIGPALMIVRSLARRSQLPILAHCLRTGRKMKTPLTMKKTKVIRRLWTGVSS
jgi:hypothetical protein